MPRSFFFTSESVTEGHPDKACDVVSDAILDACLEEDPNARVACETAIKTLVGNQGRRHLFGDDGVLLTSAHITGSLLTLLGEVRVDGSVNFVQAAVDALEWIGYNSPHAGFDWRNMELTCAIEAQSPDIAQGVDEGSGLHTEQGAGDQGMMTGYACNETPELAPASFVFAQNLKIALSAARRDGLLTWLQPDGKTQVTVEYENGVVTRIAKVVVSCQHHAEMDDHTAIFNTVRDMVIVPTLEGTDLLDERTEFFINPTGRFVVGGPHGDAGLTGRKIIVDTYGAHGGHGGGAFSGKDPSKVDRSAAYITRYIAKNLVAAGLCDRAQVQLAYAIGVAEPMSVMVDTFGTRGTGLTDERLAAAVREVFPLKPARLIEHLDLKRPGYRDTAAFGHFGRVVKPDADSRFTWERTDMVDALHTVIGSV